MSEFTQEFSNLVFGRTAPEPEDNGMEAPAPTAPVIPSQGDMPRPTGNPSRLFVNQLFDRIA